MRQQIGQSFCQQTDCSQKNQSANTQQPCVQTNYPNVYLKTQQYGKDRVRLLRVVKNNCGDWHEVLDYTVRIMLDGDFDASYTMADNRKVIAADTLKNTVYVLAKKSQNIRSLELFGAELAQHFLDKYCHVSHAEIQLVSSPWNRVSLCGKEEQYTFVRNNEEVRYTKIDLIRPDPCYNSRKITVVSGIQGLTVMKTTGSSFQNFHRDELTTLPDMADFVLSTTVDAKWRYQANFVHELNCLDFNALYSKVRNTTLEVFSRDNSTSVKSTVYKMGEKVLLYAPEILEVSYALPKISTYSVDMKNFGLNNGNACAEVFMPLENPSGLITATIARKQGKL